MKSLLRDYTTRGANQPSVKSLYIYFLFYKTWHKKIRNVKQYLQNSLNLVILFCFLNFNDSELSLIKTLMSCYRGLEHIISAMAIHLQYYI